MSRWFEVELPKIKIYDEFDKILHQVSKDVTFPVSKEDQKLAEDTIKYLKWVKMKKLLKNTT